MSRLAGSILSGGGEQRSIRVRIEGSGERRQNGGIRGGLTRRVSDDFRGSGTRHVWTGRVNIDLTSFEAPLRWRRPLRIFVNSMSDLFQDAVPDEVISQIWSVMRNARWHTFQILTKRPERMRELLSRPDFRLPNVWLGTS